MLFLDVLVQLIICESYHMVILCRQNHSGVDFFNVCITRFKKYMYKNKTLSLAQTEA